MSLRIRASFQRQAADETYLYLELDLKRLVDFSQEQLIIGLDTYDRNRGNLRYGTALDTAAGSGLEYIIEINGNNQAAAGTAGI